jgi:hypothetical protein
MDSNGIHNLPNGNEKLLGFGLGSCTDSVGIHEPPAKRTNPPKSNATSVDKHFAPQMAGLAKACSGPCRVQSIPGEKNARI